MRNLKAIKICTFIGMAAGAFAWILLRSYLFGSDNAWFTGSPGPMGHDVRVYISHQYDLAEPYWQLPFAITLFGTAVGTLAAVLRVNLTIISQAIIFAGRAVLANWGWALTLLVLPLLGSCLAAFFAGQRHQYQAPASSFRLRWSNPGALAMCICTVFFVLPWALDLVNELNPKMQIPIITWACLLGGVLMAQISSGIWLESAKTWAALKCITFRSCRLHRVRHILAMNFLFYFALICAGLPVGMFYFFLLYETPQLEVNMQATGMTIPVAFSAIVTAGRFLAAYWYWTLATPLLVFFSLCNAKLWVSFEDQEKLPPQNSP